MDNLAAITKSVTEVCKKAGAFLMEQFQNFDTRLVEYKGINDVVSYVDKEAEKLLIAGLKEILPTAAFITEEGTLNKYEMGFIPQEGLYWLIDPLDGTTNFIHGLPVFAVSVGLWHNGQLIAGCVYEPNRDECFYAWDGGGAWLNGNTIKVSDTENLGESLLATGFPFAEFSKMTEYLSILNKLMQSSHGLRRMGSAAVDLAYVASGRFQGFFEYNLKPWDVAAGAIIVKEAGGTVTDFRGGTDFVFGKEIVAAGKIHQPMQELIKQFWVSGPIKY